MLSGTTLRDTPRVRAGDRLGREAHAHVREPLLFLERILDELPRVPFKENVWQLFLRDNAKRLLGLD